MPNLEFPNSPTDGQTYSPNYLPGLPTYTWVARTSTWEVVSAGAGGSVKPDWDAPEGSDAEILNKPPVVGIAAGLAISLG